MLIEDYSFIEAFYMTIITISTVGFKEVTTLSDGGRVFTAFFIITNIGIFTYAISNIASFIIEGHVKHAFKDLRVEKEIHKLENHTIVCGFGRNGQEAVDELDSHGEKLVVIEIDHIRIESLRDNEKILYIEGDASQDEILIKAGIERAKALISTLPKDADNVFVALTAKEINPKLNVVCRATEASSEKKLFRAGADHVIMPDKIGGFHMAQLVMKPDIVEFFKVLSGPEGASLFFEELNLEELSDAIAAKNIGDLEIRQRTGANIIGLKTVSGEYLVNPSPKIKVGTCSKLIVLGDEQQIEEFKDFILTNSEQTYES